VTDEQVSHCLQGGLGMKVGPHLGAEGHGGAFIHGVEHFYPVLPLAVGQLGYLLC